MHGRHDLAEEVSRLVLLQPALGAHVGVQVRAGRGEDQVGLCVRSDHLLHSVDVRTPGHPVVSQQ